MGIVATLLLSLVALLTTSCSKQSVSGAASPPNPPAVRVAAVQVEPQPFAPSIAITGTLISRTSVTVKAETTGRVVRIAKEEGDHVTAGEPVVFVDDSHEKIALHQAESSVAVAQAALERAKLLESHSRAEWTRAENLLKSGGITDRDHKAAQIARKDAAAQVSLSEAQLEQAQAQVEAARKLLHDSVVRSPITGEVQTKLTAAGAYVEPPTPVFAVVDNSQLELESMVPAAHLGYVRPGQPVVFDVNTWPGHRFEGHVLEIAPAVQTETRSGKVRIRVGNSGGRLKAGMFAQGEIITGATRSAMLIPPDAAYRDERTGSKARVFVVENGRAATREVTIGAERENMLEITGGLKAGDVVVAEQSIELADGVAVQPQLRGKS